MKVLVVYYGGKSTFIQRDIDILAKHFEVSEIQIKKFSDILPLIKKVKWSNVVYIWFAGKHAGVSVLLAKLFRKKSIVVVGGYDAANLPEINYGLWAVGSFGDKKLAKYSLKNADVVIAVSKNLVENLKKYANIKREIIVIPTGYDPDFWKRDEVKKNNIVLTVAIINNERRIKIKGIDTFLKVANILPDIKFKIVGVTDSMKDIISSMVQSNNVEIIPPLPPEKLLPQYQSAKVFALFSRSEGLPNTLCEAMLCECVPVVTNVGAMPDVVNDCGFVINGDLNEIVDAIKKALETTEDLRRKSRERIITLFPIEKREIEIISLIKN